MKKTSVSLPLLMIAAGGLLLLAAAIWAATDSPTTSPTAENASDIPYPEISRVSVQEAYTQFVDGTAIFLDVRDTGSFSAAHVPGAVNIPLSELEQRLGELPQTARIITYCT
jgi:rhodanese-related sulfurtransferase